MAEQDENEVEASSADVQFGRLYLPCPVCRKAVSVAQAARNDPEPPRYECPACGTTFVVVTD
jgi:transposase-like protein